MTIPVQIEHGNHAIAAHLHALPRAGETMMCPFPTSIGDEKLYLVVTGVCHHQQGAFDGKKCRDPFMIRITTEGDPRFKKENDAVMAKAFQGK